MNKTFALTSIKKIIELELQIEDNENLKNIQSEIKSKFNQLYATIEKMYSINPQIKINIYNTLKNNNLSLNNILYQFKEESEVEENIPENELKKIDKFSKLSDIFYFVREIIKLESSTIYYLCFYQPNQYTEEHYAASDLTVDIAKFIMSSFKIPSSYIKDIFNEIGESNPKRDIVQDIIHNESCYEWCNQEQSEYYKMRDYSKTSDKPYYSVEEMCEKNEIFKSSFEEFKRKKEETLKNNPYNLSQYDIERHNSYLLNVLEKYSHKFNIKEELYKNENTNCYKVGYFEDFCFSGISFIKNFEKELKTEEKAKDFLNIKKYFNYKKLNYEDLVNLLEYFRELGVSGTIYCTKEKWKSTIESEPIVRKVYIKIESINIRKGFKLREEDIKDLQEILSQEEINKILIDS